MIRSWILKELVYSWRRLAFLVLLVGIGYVLAVIIETFAVGGSYPFSGLFHLLNDFSFAWVLSASITLPLVSLEYRRDTMQFLAVLPVRQHQVVFIKFLIGLATIVSVSGLLVGLIWCTQLDRPDIPATLVLNTAIRTMEHVIAVFFVCFACSFMGVYGIVGIAILWHFTFTLLPSEPSSLVFILPAIIIHVCDRPLRGAFGLESCLPPSYGPGSTWGIVIFSTAVIYLLGIFKKGRLARTLYQHRIGRVGVLVGLLIFGVVSQSQFYAFLPALENFWERHTNHSDLPSEFVSQDSNVGFSTSRLNRIETLASESALELRKKLPGINILPIHLKKGHGLWDVHVGLTWPNGSVEVFVPVKTPEVPDTDIVVAWLEALMTRRLPPGVPGEDLQWALLAAPRLLVDPLTGEADAWDRAVQRNRKQYTSIHFENFSSWSSLLRQRGRCFAEATAVSFFHYLSPTDAQQWLPSLLRGESDPTLAHRIAMQFRSFHSNEGHKYREITNEQTTDLRAPFNSIGFLYPPAASPPRLVFWGVQTPAMAGHLRVTRTALNPLTGLPIDSWVHEELDLNSTAIPRVDRSSIPGTIEETSIESYVPELQCAVRFGIDEARIGW